MAKIYYYRLPEFWRKEQKYLFLHIKNNYTNIDWQEITPDKKHTWLTEGLHEEFDDFIPLGTKEAKAQKGITEGVIFKIYGGGVLTSRDAWAYNFNQQALEENMQATITFYNQQIKLWVNKTNKNIKVDDFVIHDDSKISWSRNLKRQLKGGNLAIFHDKKIRKSLYRPFIKTNLFFDRVMNNDVYPMTVIFPTPEAENIVICVTNHSQIPFVVQITNRIPEFAVGGRTTQCFPFYTYNEDGSNRTENITDWALNHWQQHYQDQTISKWDIFYYTYGLLHQPQYREKYAQNLKRELPRLPLTPKFWEFSKAGQQLAELHLNYEQAEPYQLEEIENPKYPYSLEVEKMRLSKDKSQLIYNNFLTLTGIPKPAFDYKLGNRSALEWVIDQYRVKTDKRSGIINNPNRKEDDYILQLIGKVITVSLETVGIVLKLKDLDL